MNAIQLCGLMLALTMTAQNHASASEVEAGWIARRCAAYQGGYCRVSFDVALANAAELSNVTGGVQLRGYLVKESIGYALYESKSSAQRGWRTDAILIQPPISEEIVKSLDRRDQSLVVLKGRIQLAVVESEEYWLQFAVDHPASIAPVVGEKLKK
jgi:hypothetical protein